MTGGNDMFKYDFENENYNVRQAVEEARTNPEVALWFIDQLSDYELTKIFTKAWCETMEHKHFANPETVREINNAINKKRAEKEK